MSEEPVKKVRPEEAALVAFKRHERQDFKDKNTAEQYVAWLEAAYDQAIEAWGHYRSRWSDQMEQTMAATRERSKVVKSVKLELAQQGIQSGSHMSLENAVEVVAVNYDNRGNVIEQMQPVRWRVNQREFEKMEKRVAELEAKLQTQSPESTP